MRSRLWNLGLGLLSIVASAVTLIWWIPNDIETGVFVQDRYSVDIGDAFAPTAVAVGILLLGVGIVATSYFKRGHEPADPAERATGISRGSVAFLIFTLSVLIGSLLLMTWAGPLTVSAMQSAGYEVKAYRMLTDTRPYKFIGFAIGGWVMVLSLITWIEGRLSLGGILTAVGAVVALIVVYDVPFDSLLLPPNGSQ